MLWLVSPVHGREGLTRLCLEQRRILVDELAELGLEAHVLVIGQGTDLGAARELELQVLERPNVLGLRVNDGLEWAFREGGATHAAFVGSDDWLTADHLADLPAQGRARASRWVSFVSPDGRLLASMEGAPPKGRVPWTMSRELLEPVGFRPADDTARRGVDSSILRGLPVPRAEAFEFRPDDDPLRCVDFKTRGEQLTPWRLQAASRYSRPNPFELLATRYPLELVERMEKFYAEGGAC